METIPENTNTSNGWQNLSLVFHSLVISPKKNEVWTFLNCIHYNDRRWFCSWVEIIYREYYIIQLLKIMTNAKNCRIIPCMLTVPVIPYYQSVTILWGIDIIWWPGKVCVHALTMSPFIYRKSIQVEDQFNYHYFMRILFSRIFVDLENQRSLAHEQTEKLEGPVCLQWLKSLIFCEGL